MTVQIKLPELAGGDLIAFEGTGFVSNAIGFFTGSVLSHVATVLDPRLIVDGKPQTELNLIESTILDSKSGPQVNPLLPRITGYDAGGRVWALRLSNKIRAMIDWDAVWTWAQAKLAAHDSYNKIELGEYVFRKLPLIGDLPILYKPNPHEEVCSELAAELYQAGGLPALDPFTTPPQRLAALRIWADCTQLVGSPRAIKNFNTV